MDSDDLWALTLIFVPLSLVSLGGGSSIVAPLEQAVVQHHNWMTGQEFLNLFAISRAAPGPGIMLAPLIGWKVAEGWGAVVASLGLFVPSSLLCYMLFRTTNAHRNRRWHRVLREGLAPIGTGLIIAGMITIFRVSGGGWLAASIAAMSLATLLRFPNFPAPVLLASGAAITWSLHLILKT